jgi:hypothetical protein
VDNLLKLAYAINGNGVALSKKPTFRLKMKMCACGRLPTLSRFSSAPLAVGALRIRGGGLTDKNNEVVGVVMEY